jgi:ketosteroid isomerase-like protein
MSHARTRSREAVIRDYLAAVDQGDANAPLGFVTDDIAFSAGNAEPVHGKQNFGELGCQFTQSIKGVRHEIHDVWHAAEDADVLIARMTVHYTRLDGSGLSLPCCNVFRMSGELIAEFHVYIDMNPVFA